MVTRKFGQQLVMLRFQVRPQEGQEEADVTTRGMEDVLREDLEEN